MNREYYFEKAPVPQAIIKFAVPTILSQMVTLVYNLADTVFVGHTNDPNQVAALALSFPLFMFSTAMGNLFGVGSNSLIARCLGSRDTERIHKASAFGFWGSFLAAVLLSLVLLFGMRPILYGIGASDATYAYTASYLRWTICVGGVPTVLHLVLSHLIRSEGNTRQASIGMSLGAVLNIFLDPLMVTGLGMGITGAAIATAFSNTVSMVYLLWVLWSTRRDSCLSIRLSDFVKYWGSVAKDILLVGFPAALIIFLGSTANIVLIRFLSAYGDLGVASYGIVQKTGTVVIQITVGLTQGVMPLVSYNFGAENRGRTSEISRDSALFLGAYCVLCLALVETFPRAVMHLFIEEEATVELGVGFLRIWFWSTPGMAFTNLFNALFQAMGKWKHSLFLSVFRQICLFIPMIMLMNALAGMYGIILAQPISDTLALATGAVLFAKTSRSAASGPENAGKSPR